MHQQKINENTIADEFPGCKVVEVSDYCKAVIRGQSFPTVIAFSSVNTERGRFKPFKAIAEASCNIVFVNDNGNNWYLKGVEGFSEDFRDAAQGLVNFAREIGSGHVMTFGTSMGAFGSLVYAAAGGADTCLSFGPEVMLDIPGSRSDQHKVKDSFLSLSDVLELIKSSKSSFYVFTSECDEIDLINAIALKGIKNLRLLTARGVEHPGIQVFAEGVGVGSLIDQAMADPEKIVDFDQRGDILSNEELIKDMWIAFGLKKEKRLRNYLDYLLLCVDKFPNSSPLMYRLGEAHYRNGNAKKAIECLLKSVRLDGLQFEAYNMLGAIQRRRREYSEAEKNLRKSLSISPRNAFAYHNLGLLMMDVGRVKEAVSCFEKSVGINRGNTSFAASLSDAREKLASANA